MVVRLVVRLIGHVVDLKLAGVVYLVVWPVEAEKCLGGGEKIVDMLFQI